MQEGDDLDKKSLRKSMIDKMKKFSYNSNKSDIDAYLADLLFDTEEYLNAHRIGIVLSMSHEVDTYSIIKQILDDGKQVFVPNTNYQEKSMTFKRLLNLQQIDKDEKGIYQVMGETELSNQLDLVVVPGVVFNQTGYRIGYGGGYFDKFLHQFNPTTLSLIYDFQLSDFEPESHDQPVSKLLVATTK